MAALRDNSLAAGRDLAAHCLRMQERIDQGRCVLVDLLDVSGLRKIEPPQIFRKENGKVWAGNYVGVFECSEGGRTEHVVISSRFDEGRTDSFFLRAMLEACWDTPLLFLEESRNSPADHPYDHLMAIRLAMQLERTWKRGQLRLYRSRQMYDSRIQGRLDLPRQIRENPGLSDGRAAYVVREYTGEHDYASLFLRALLEAEKANPDFMRRLRQERPQFRLAQRALLQQATGGERMNRRVLLARTRNRITNPVYREYEVLRVLSRAMLRRMGGYQVREADQASPFVTGVFLDISQLWELYLAEKVFKSLPLALRKPCCQREVSLLEGAVNIRPDFWWEERGGIVLDAKYRPVWARAYGRFPERFPEEVRENIYQVMSYMLALDCGRGGVVFPTGARGQDPKPFRVWPGHVCRTFWLAGFTVPGEKADYEAFRKEMDREAERLAGNLGGSIFA